MHNKHADHFREIEDYYSPKMKNNAPDYKVLGWENREAHMRRFRTLVDYVDIQNKSILDVGCGLGTLNDFLKEKGITASYTGIDILPEMISRAQQRHAEADFRCMDLFDEKLDFNEVYNIVFASGIFNLNLGNNDEFLHKALTRFFKLSDAVIAFNILHEDSENREDRYYYSNPSRINLILEPFRDRFKEVEFYHSYQKNDFTVVVRIS